MPKKVLARDSKGALSRDASLIQTFPPITTDRRGNPQGDVYNDEDLWAREKETLRQAAAEFARQRSELEAEAMSQLAAVDEENSLEVITESLEDSSPEVRKAAVRALYRVNSEYAASFFNSALREGPSERRRRFGAALAGSGLVDEAIQQLKSGGRQNVYSTISLLFLVAKAGEVQPLVSLLEDHPSIELRLALIELLALSGEPAIVPAFRRLAERRALPSEVRSAVMEAIYQVRSQIREDAPIG